MKRAGSLDRYKSALVAWSAAILDLMMKFQEASALPAVLDVLGPKTLSHPWHRIGVAELRQSQRVER